MALKRKADLVSSSSEESSSSSSSDDNAPAAGALPRGSTASDRTRKERRSLPSSTAGPDLKKQRLSLGGASLAKGKKRGPRVVSYRSLDGQREFDRVFNLELSTLASLKSLILSKLALSPTTAVNLALLRPPLAQGGAERVVDLQDAEDYEAFYARASGNDLGDGEVIVRYEIWSASVGKGASSSGPATTVGQQQVDLTNPSTPATEPKKKRVRKSLAEKSVAPPSTDLAAVEPGPSVPSSSLTLATDPVEPAPQAASKTAKKPKLNKKDKKRAASASVSGRSTPVPTSPLPAASTSPNGMSKSTVPPSPSRLAASISAAIEPESNGKASKKDKKRKEQIKGAALVLAQQPSRSSSLADAAPLPPPPAPVPTPKSTTSIQSNLDRILAGRHVNSPSTTSRASVVTATPASPLPPPIATHASIAAVADPVDAPSKPPKKAKKTKKEKEKVPSTYGAQEDAETAARKKAVMEALFGKKTMPATTSTVPPPPPPPPLVESSAIVSPQQPAHSTPSRPTSTATPSSHLAVEQAPAPKITDLSTLTSSQPKKTSKKSGGGLSVLSGEDRGSPAKKTQEPPAEEREAEEDVEMAEERVKCPVKVVSSPTKPRSPTLSPQPTAPSAPPSESNRSNDVYMQTPGEGSSDEESSSSSDEDEDDHPPSTQEERLTAPLTQAALSTLPQSDTEDEDDDVAQGSDEGSLQYSDAEYVEDKTDRRKSRVSFSQLSARSRRAGSGDSSDQEGILPPGITLQDDVDMENNDEVVELEEDGAVEQPEDDEDEDPIRTADESSPMRTNVTAPSSPINEGSQPPVLDQQDSASEAVDSDNDEEQHPAQEVNGHPSSPTSHHSLPAWVTHTQSEPLLSPTRSRKTNVSSPPKPNLSEIDELDSSQPPLTFTKATKALADAFAMDGSTNGHIKDHSLQETEVPATQVERRSSFPAVQEEAEDEEVKKSSPPPSTPNGHPLVNVNPPSSPTKPSATQEPDVDESLPESPAVADSPLPVREEPSVVPQEEEAVQPDSAPQTPATRRSTRSKGAAVVAPPSTRATRRSASQTVDGPSQALEAPDSSQTAGRRLRSREPSEKPQSHVELPVALKTRGKKAAQLNGSQPPPPPAVPEIEEVVEDSTQPSPSAAFAGANSPAPEESQLDAEDDTLAASSLPADPPSSSMYPRLPPLPSSQPSRAARRAPGLFDLSQRSKAEFAIAGSGHSTPKAKGRQSLSNGPSNSSQPSQGVFGKLGSWLSGNGSTDEPPHDKQGEEESSSSESDDESSDDERAKAVKGRLARPKLGRKKKSLLGGL